MVASSLPEPKKSGFLSTIRGAVDSLLNVPRTITTRFGQQTQVPPQPNINPTPTPHPLQPYLDRGWKLSADSDPIDSPVQQPRQGQRSMSTAVPQIREQGTLAQAINSYWPKEQYGNIIRVLDGENRGRDPNSINKNKDGSLDIGLFQINSNTFSDFMRRKGDVISAMGINTFEDLFDPVKNIQMAKIIWDEQGWNAWYGAPSELRIKKKVR